MPLVLLEAIDEMGKTTLIKELKEKYPYLKSIAFPVNRSILNIDYDKDDEQSIKGYHKMFMKDFVDNQNKIVELSGEDGHKNTVLMDRYIISWTAYFMADITPLISRQFKYNTDKVLDYLIKIQNTLFTVLISDLILPDLVIYLYPPPEKQVGTRIYGLLGTYAMALTAVKKGQIPVEEIKALQPDTFQKVEIALKTRGYI